MAEIVTLTRRPSGLLSLADALLVSDGLRRGGLAVLPTETGYMLAARACDEAAVLRAFEVKRRDPAQPMHVACGSLEMARRFAVLSAAAERVMGAFTPGPVTVVAPKKEPLPDRLVTLRGTVGLRIPDCAATLQVVLALGEPITATSLNESGQESVSIEPEELATLPWPEGAGAVYVVEGEDVITRQAASTLALIREGEPAVEILREGPVSRDEILRVASPP